MCDDRLHSSCWCKIDPGLASPLPKGSTQAGAVDSHRAAEGFLNPKQKDSLVCGRHFLLGKPFSDESHPVFTSRAVHASAMTIAGRQPRRTSWPVQAFSGKISYGESPPRKRSAWTLPKRPPLLHHRLFLSSCIFKTSRNSNSTNSPANTEYDSNSSTRCRSRSTDSGQNGFSTIKNWYHRLGIALPELYLWSRRPLPHRRLVFFSKQVDFPIRQFTCDTLWSLRESGSTTRCLSQSMGSRAEPMLHPTVSDKQSSKLRPVKVSRLRSNGNLPKFQAKAEQRPNSSQLLIFELFCPQLAPWLSYPGQSLVQTNGVYRQVTAPSFYRSELSIIELYWSSLCFLEEWPDFFDEQLAGCSQMWLLTLLSWMSEKLPVITKRKLTCSIVSVRWSCFHKPSLDLVFQH